MFDLIHENKPIRTQKSGGSYEEIIRLQTESRWSQLENASLLDVLNYWLETLQPLTRRNYGAGFRKLFELGLINPQLNLQEFALLNHDALVDEIKLVSGWTEATKQARAAAFISFTSFLQRRTKSLIRKAVPNKEGVNKTFFKIRDKVKTEALSIDETQSFLKAITAINPRDALIAKLILQGGKRKSEVLDLERSGIDFEKNRITYRQSKTRGMEKVTIINYPPHIMQELKLYIGERNGVVFLTRNFKKIAPFQIDRNFLKAGELAGIPFRVTPHVLRVTLVTRLKERKVQDSDIMKITGHASPAQLSSYDKSDLGDNASAHFNFV